MAALMRLLVRLLITSLLTIPTTASPPTRQLTLSPRDDSGPTDGSLLTYPIPGCSDESPLGGGESWSLPGDDCLKVSTSTSFRILEPAICPNGTRAKFARYEGRDCNYGKVTVQGGLEEVTDDDLNACQSISMEGHKSNATHASLASFGFYCDGRKGDDDGETKAEWGSVSTNTCPRGRDPPVRSPTFNHPMPGQCSAILRTERLDIFSPATCSDGSQAKLAKWYGTRTCKGDYDEVVDVTDELMRECFFVNREEHSSFAFWCPENGAGRSTGRLSVWLALLFGALFLF